MSRWEPGAQSRLANAALGLYASKGFEETTVSEIAQAAGLTERTFFRHFADKREVLFAGSDLLEQHMVGGIAAAEKGAGPLALVRSAVDAAADFFPAERRTHSRERSAVIAANPQLLERELRKMSSLAEAISVSLRERGIGEPTASLAAQSGVTVFRLAFAEWIADGSERSFADIQHDMFAQFDALG